MAFLRKGNLVPSLSETRHIQTLVADGEVKLAQFERARAQLAAQTERLQADLHAWKQMLSPMRRLPLELLSEIFFRVLGYHDEDDPAVMGSLSRICQVCSRWRTLAFSIPRLWTNMFFSVPETGPITHTLFAIIGDYLPRSAPHHLHLRFDTPIYATHPPENISTLLRAVVPFLDRLRSLQLHLPLEALLAFSHFPDKPDALPVLDAFSFSPPANISEPHMTGVDMALAPVLLKAPHLRDIDLSISDGNTLRAWPIPWSQIVILDLHQFFDTPESAQEALSHCSSLEQCSLKPIPLRHTGNPNSTSPLPITLPLLKSMDIEFLYEIDDTTEGAASFFRHLNMPALSELQLFINAGADEFEVPLFVTHLFLRSGPSLKTLVLFGVQFEEGDIELLLQSLPVLVNLKCEYCLVGHDQLFDALQYHGPDGLPPLVPRLEKLEVLEYDVRMPITPHKIADTIVSRWWSDEDLLVVRPPVARWKNVQIWWENGGTLELDEATWDRISICCDEGLIVDLEVQ
ncbi:uncharacterized protein STEHIDRAFT_156204 [Stereum hirsutum FP-91666 SS1]|uniref:uncharacterized protein n=1 Tax=Stereum hirsutum (strain FP-91666) TaxID=721885 RepID=UPI000440F028|nr:uncharacterized protein STEHIDRAFT_156204 [Stereum hirsutum FP-91666 SS1]EIM87217.1 hypothetical protein STEHIDRAFT_156204 [Stereum hirsutum FP-91666 SS1]